MYKLNIFRCNLSFVTEKRWICRLIVNLQSALVHHEGKTVPKEFWLFLTNQSFWWGLSYTGINDPFAGLFITLSWVWINHCFTARKGSALGLGLYNWNNSNIKWFKPCAAKHSVRKFLKTSHGKQELQKNIASFCRNKWNPFTR